MNSDLHGLKCKYSNQCTVFTLFPIKAISYENIEAQICCENFPKNYEKLEI